MAVLGFGAHLALSMFGPGYARAATLPLWLLVIGYLPNIPKMQYIAVCRAAGRIPRAAAVMTVAAVMEVTASAIGGEYGGLKGLSFALLAVFIFEGLVTTPPVLRAAMGRGRHRQADSSVTAFDNFTKVARPGGDAVVTARILPKPVSAGLGVHAEAATISEVTDAEQRERQLAGIDTLLWLARAQAPPQL
jgi:hypothetical protein